MREWLASIVGESLAPIMTVILAAALVVLLALVLIGLAKRVFAGSGGIGGRSRAPRLAVLDMAPVDPKRKLVLVRRDDVEHLLLIGGQNDLVVEPGIVRGQPRKARQEPGFAEPDQRIAAQPQPQPQQALPHRRTPRPSVQPVPSDAQQPGEHPPMAPVAETPIAPAQESRQQPDARAPATAPVPNRAPQVEPRVATPTTSVHPQAAVPRVQPDVVPAPVVVPPVPAVQPPIVAAAPPVWVAEEPTSPRRPEPHGPTDPVVPSRRTVEVAAPVPPPPPRGLPTTTFVEPAARRSEATPAVPPTSAQTYEPPRQPIIPPAPIQRQPVTPVAPVVAAPPPAPMPPAPQPQPNAERPPVAQPTQPPASPPVSAPPRSMATPTLPQPSRATPVAPPVRNDIEATPARSFWSTTPAVPTDAPPQSGRDADAPRSEPEDGRGAAPIVPPLPDRIPVRWPSAPVAPRADSNADAEVGFAGPKADADTAGPAPLSVRSFASTIQDRRASPVAETAPAVTAPTRTAPLPPVAAPPVYAAAPVAAAPPVAAASETQADDPRTPPHEETERALTLEEEMERLLHDFTIDVSERR